MTLVRYWKKIQENEKIKALWTRFITREFHKLYYGTPEKEGPWSYNTFWMGVPTFKCPLDLWIYQEILYRIRPDLIIETGSAYGGSALYLASVCDQIGHGAIVSIDIVGDVERPKHHRITFLTGSSTSSSVVSQVNQKVQNGMKVLVILDSDHRMDHVLKEMEIYSQYVSRESYLIVEDTNVNGHPVSPDYGPGPMEAVQRFLRENRSFEIDRSLEKFLLTFNPCGFLKRVR